MKQNIGILFVAFFLWTIPESIGSGNTSFARVEALLAQKYSPMRQKALGDLVMSPSRHAQQSEQLRMRKNCKGVGMDCQHAEECCTFLCLKRYNECVF